MNLITRPDLDGVACAVMITTIEQIERVIFADPKDIDDGSVKVKKGDVVANLPYHPNAGLWFDHHDQAEDESWETASAVRGRRGQAPSASRLVCDHYASSRLERFAEMVTYTDKVDSANLTEDEVMNPSGWVLLGFTLDPYMGLKAFHGYANAIIAAIRGGSTIEQVLDMSEVKGRINLYQKDMDDFRVEIKEVTRLEDHVLITDIREAEVLPTGNRFIVFALYPEANVQLALSINKEKQKVRVRVGKSIFNRSCNIHIGRMLADYDGGGLDGAGGCLLDFDDAEAKIAEIIDRLKTG